MKTLLSLIGLIFALTLTSNVTTAKIIKISEETVNAAFEKPIPNHPRLFLTEPQLTTLKQKIKSDQMLTGIHDALIAGAERLIDQPPLKRVVTGRRLLSVSRECLRRTMLLSYAWRMTDDRRFLNRCEQEMLAAAEFTNWNPSHFLDVAEMTAALALGYDWLYPELDPASRQSIADAILEKGLKPSFDARYNWFVRGRNNWNQVCHSGMTMGALAILEDQGQLAREIVHRAVNNVQTVMELYEPDGAYPEGPGYWVYGTTYNVMLLAALESALGTDFGLSDKQGFSHAAVYLNNVTGPFRQYFNYPDSGSKVGFTPAVFWFAHHYNDPTMAWMQHRYVSSRFPNKTSEFANDRTAPLALIWAGDKATPPQSLGWMGRGQTPVAMFRTNWTDNNATWLAIKAGSPSVSHGHMDVGSFVLDAAGQRWAVDLGPEDYNKIETLGMNLWAMGQDAQRWAIFRYNNLSHNTLVVNGQHQIVSGKASFTRFSNDKPFNHAVMDMSNVYLGQLEKALRGAALLPTGQILIQDEITALDKPASIRWAMATPAQVAIKDDLNADLKLNGKTMAFQLLGDLPARLTTYSTEPKADYDEPNPNTIMIGFEVRLEPNQSIRLPILMTPPGVTQTPVIPAKSVLEWSAPLP